MLFFHDLFYNHLLQWECRLVRTKSVDLNMDWNSRRITAIIENALLEDRATSDATSYACIDPSQRASATILAKQDCILAGIGCVGRILDVYAALDGAVTSHYEVTTHPEIFDGVRLRKGQSVAVIRHNARVILSCERVILNFLQRMSGIATLTRKFVEEVAGTKARILDTRKTAPGLRVIDKYAVRCGGGQNHRLDLSDGVLIKNNHIALAGGIVPAVDRAVRNRRGAQPIEVEVRSMEELEAALAHGAEAILLDNMAPEEVRRAVEHCSLPDIQKKGRSIPLECSGGIRLENVRAYAETGVDFISVGLLTHSPQAVDMSLRVAPV
jgi:nicotinate-nucleotide pyrophosphorylase (carboxylating)